MYSQDSQQPHQDLVRHVLPRNESRHWGSMVIYPSNARFAFQKKSEKIYILTRKHFITNFGWIFRASVLCLLPFILLIVGNTLLPEMFQDYIAGDSFMNHINNTELTITIISGIILYYSFIFTYVWNNFISWFHNVYLITNERMIHTQFKLMTGTKISEAPLNNIVDIAQENYGFFPSLFNYGNVKVQTATAMKSKFDFKQIPDPSWFRSVLYELVKLNVEGEP